jgi:hypothetical protein
MRRASTSPEVETNSGLTYEQPMLTVIGNLHDVLAGTTQHLFCDSINGQTGNGDGDSSNPVCG